MYKNQSIKYQSLNTELQKTIIETSNMKKGELNHVKTIKIISMLQ